MKCEECRILIEDYVDGALERKEATVVTSHIASCGECASVHESLGREQEVYSRYQRNVDVSPALWASIETGIKRERAAEPIGLISRLRAHLAGVSSAPRLSPVFAAALVVIAIGITIGVMTYLNSRDSRQQVAKITNVQPPAREAGGTEVTPEAPGAPNQPSAVQNNPSAAKQATILPRVNNDAAQNQRALSAARATPAQLVREAEQKYVAAIAMLSRHVNRRRSHLDPMMLARFDAALNEIDRTIKQTGRVVRENPNDPIALQYLLAAYSTKVDVLREMTID